MAFLFVIVDLLVFAGMTARWCYCVARRMLPQMAMPPTVGMIYAVANKSFDVTAAMRSFYATERAPTIDQAGDYLRKHARINAHTLVLYLTHQARVHVISIDMQKRSVTWGGAIAFNSMVIEDLLEYSARVDLKNMVLVEASSGEVLGDDSEEIPDLPADIVKDWPAEPPAYIKYVDDDHEEDSEEEKNAADINAQYANLLADQRIDIRASSVIDE